MYTQIFMILEKFNLLLKNLKTVYARYTETIKGLVTAPNKIKKYAKLILLTL